MLQKNKKLVPLRDEKTKNQTKKDQSSSKSEITGQGTKILFDKTVEKKIKLRSPTVFISFPGPGCVGSICTNYLFQELHMIPIGYLDSDYLIPCIIYSADGIRHPFCIYSDLDGDNCVISCETPILIQGINPILDVIMKWITQIKAKEIIVFDSLPVDEYSIPNREPIVISNENESLNDKTKKTSTNGEQNQNQNIVNAFSSASIIAGMSGGIMSICLCKKISFRTLLISSIKHVLNFEGAAILLNELNKFDIIEELEIDIDNIKSQLEDVRKQHNKPQDPAQRWKALSSLAYQGLNKIWYE